MAFCTMLLVDWSYQGKGDGKKLMEYWEIVRLENKIFRCIHQLLCYNVIRKGNRHRVVDQE